MIVSFEDEGTRDVYNGTKSKQARKACPTDIVAVARMMDAITPRMAIFFPRYILPPK